MGSTPLCCCADSVMSHQLLTSCLLEALSINSPLLERFVCDWKEPLQNQPAIIHCHHTCSYAELTCSQLHEG